MSSLTTLARPYAKAAFELAEAEQALTGWDEMLVLASEIVTEPSMASLLGSPDFGNTQAVNLIIEVAWRCCRRSASCTRSCGKRQKIA
jgi:F-type H+-transporting ATPase subunit delta